MLEITNQKNFNTHIRNSTSYIIHYVKITYSISFINGEFFLYSIVHKHIKGWRGVLKKKNTPHSSSLSHKTRFIVQGYSWFLYKWETKAIDELDLMEIYNFWSGKKRFKWFRTLMKSPITRLITLFSLRSPLRVIFPTNLKMGWLLEKEEQNATQSTRINSTPPSLLEL